MTKAGVNAYLLKVAVIFTCLMIGCGNGTPPKGNTSQPGKEPAKAAKPPEKVAVESAGNLGKAARSEIEQRLLTILRRYFGAADRDTARMVIHSKSLLLVGDQSRHALTYLQPGRRPRTKFKLVTFAHLVIDGDYAICRGTLTRTAESATLTEDTLWIFRKEEGQWKMWWEAPIGVRRGMATAGATVSVAAPRGEAEVAELQEQLHRVLLTRFAAFNKKDTQSWTGAIHSQSPLLPGRDYFLRQMCDKLEVVTFRYLATNGDCAFGRGKLNGKFKSTGGIWQRGGALKDFNILFVFRQEDGKWKSWFDVTFFDVGLDQIYTQPGRTDRPTGLRGTDFRLD